MTDDGFEILAEGLVDAGYVTREFAGLVLGKRRHLPAADRRMAALALADWYEERGRYPEAAAERKWADALGKK